MWKTICHPLSLFGPVLLSLPIFLQIGSHILIYFKKRKTQKQMMASRKQCCKLFKTQFPLSHNVGTDNSNSNMGGLMDLWPLNFKKHTQTNRLWKHQKHKPECTTTTKTEQKTSKRSRRCDFLGCPFFTHIHAGVAPASHCTVVLATEHSCHSFARWFMDQQQLPASTTTIIICLFYLFILLRFLLLILMHHLTLLLCAVFVVA